MPLFKRKDPTPPPVPAVPARPKADEEPDWRTYDSIASEYARVHASNFAVPARDLVSLLEIKAGARVLDVGTGTGVAARGSAAVAGDALVVGVDRSLPMLAIAHGAAAGPRYAAAVAIDLPFRDSTFDYVTMNFVLSHLQRTETALFDILRVLRRGGRMGVTSWATGDDDDAFQGAWREVALEYAESEIIDDAYSRAVPWEQTVSDKTKLKEMLHDAGLRDIWLETRSYKFEMSREDYVVGREITSVGRFLHQMLGEDLWRAFQQRSREVFAERFPARLNDFREVVLAVGHKA
jgi:ubiquinone/menaquinone biosynthesis C-methylase UbiE